MSDQTAIEWCDSTFNPWLGCTKVSPACDHCYAETLMDTRMGRVEWGAGKPRVRTSAANWRKPVQWNRADGVKLRAWEGFKAQYPGLSDAELEAKGFVKPLRRRVFCASLADVFDNEVPASWRADLFALIQSTPNLDWLLLTKRIGNAAKMIDEAGGWSGVGALRTRNPLPNVWLGATICNQDEADRDIPKLLAVPAAVRFVSIEPMLGPIDYRWTPYVHQSTGETYREYLERNGKVDHLESLRRIDWVIAGGESGPEARSAHPAWFRMLRDDCDAAGIPFLFKQWGEWRPTLDGERYNTSMGRAQRTPAFIVDRKTGAVCCFENDYFEDPQVMLRVGKKSAGRLLDGREHNEFPGGAR